LALANGSAPLLPKQELHPVSNYLLPLAKILKKLICVAFVLFVMGKKSYLSPLFGIE
jgi:hypothetical protein